jgi:ribosomal-protein-alanine N-acetyltransferase
MYVRQSCIMITNFCIVPEYRGMGYGKKMMQYMFLSCTSDVAIILQVHVDNHKAQNLYRKLGFRITLILLDYYGPRQNGYLMHRSCDGFA